MNTGAELPPPPLLLLSVTTPVGVLSSVSSVPSPSVSVDSFGSNGKASAVSVMPSPSVSLVSELSPQPLSDVLNNHRLKSGG
jgi:hypothetical protein